MSDWTVCQIMTAAWMQKNEMLSVREEKTVKKTEKAVELIQEERNRQLEMWGDQSNNTLFEWMSILGEEYGELCEAANETLFFNATHRERGGKKNIIKEAVHVAAVACSIIESMIDV